MIIPNKYVMRQLSFGNDESDREPTLVDVHGNALQEFLANAVGSTVLLRSFRAQHLSNGASGFGLIGDRKSFRDRLRELCLDVRDLEAELKARSRFGRHKRDFRFSANLPRISSDDRLIEGIYRGTGRVLVASNYRFDDHDRLIVDDSSAALFIATPISTRMRLGLHLS